MKNLDIILLFDFYRGLLTQKQAEVIDLYYNEDLSLAEISEIHSVTRQGVRDSIKRAEGILIDAEQKLGVVCRYKKELLLINKAKNIADSLLKNSNDSDINNGIAQIKELLCRIEE